MSAILSFLSLMGLLEADLSSQRPSRRVSYAREARRRREEPRQRALAKRSAPAKMKVTASA